MLCLSTTDLVLSPLKVHWAVILWGIHGFDCIFQSYPKLFPPHCLRVAIIQEQRTFNCIFPNTKRHSELVFFANEFSSLTPTHRFVRSEVKERKLQ
ncbi:hypothetical protein AB6A40_011200 [Gnathostoma spinigerum]|uniref:Secreted protein n=1 Tax=Gnathostoma spinigerum TaxID=75299 RepID=A0ABD6F2J8_9BILA